MKITDFNERVQAQIRAQLRDDLRAVETTQPKLAPLPALVRGEQVAADGPRRVAVRVHLVQLRRRLLDAHDNLAFAAKPLVDAIAASLGVDDADPRIRWEYAQAKTRGQEGVIVRMEVYEHHSR